MAQGNDEVASLRQENRIMRQELAMLKTSPQLMIGYGGEGTSPLLESPNKTLSDAAFSLEGVVGGAMR